MIDVEAINVEAIDTVDPGADQRLTEVIDNQSRGDP